MNELNPSGLALGRIVVDTYDLDSVEGLGRAMRSLAATLNAMGGMSPALAGTETTYQNVIYRDGNFYGGKPSDPPNPDLLLSAAGGTIIVQEEGTPLTPSGTLNFIGANVTAVYNAGVIDITFTPGSGDFGFGVIAVSGQSNVESDVANDTLTFVAGSNMTITTNPGAGSVIFAATDTNTTYSAGTYLDLDGTTFNVDLTEVSGYDAGERQYLRNDMGTIEWVTVGVC